MAFFAKGIANKITTGAIISVIAFLITAPLIYIWQSNNRIVKLEHTAKSHENDILNLKGGLKELKMNSVRIAELKPMIESIDEKAVSNKKTLDLILRIMLEKKRANASPPSSLNGVNNTYTVCLKKQEDLF